MVFKRKIKDYWILEHTIRKGKKYLKKTKYIGKVLPSKERLEQLKKEFLREIKGEKYKYLSAEDVERIEKKKAEYKKEIKRLSLLEKEKHLKEFIIRFTYDSSKLAGVAVTLRQTSLILKEGIIPKGFKNLRTVKELENHEKGIVVITKYKGKLDLRFVKKLHKVLFAGVDDLIAGMLRNQRFLARQKRKAFLSELRNELKRNVKLTGTSYVPPKWQDLKKVLGNSERISGTPKISKKFSMELDNFFKWYKSENRKLHPLELAALVHLKLISIQLFTDGNSRLSRLLMNWILWKKDYPLIDIPIEDLENYYNALDKYQIEKKEKPFIDYVKKHFLSK